MKYLRVICGIIAFAGFLLLLGAVGGLEQNLCKGAEFLRTAGTGMMLIIAGLFGINMEN